MAKIWMITTLAKNLDFTDAFLPLVCMGNFDYPVCIGGGGRGTQVELAHLTFDSHQTWYDYTMG